MTRVLCKTDLVPIGGGEDELELPEQPDVAYQRAREGLASIGKVIEEDSDQRFLRGTVRYGLQKVRMKVDVEPTDTGSLVRIRALADDVWGKAAKATMRKLAGAIR